MIADSFIRNHLIITRSVFETYKQNAIYQSYDAQQALSIDEAVPDFNLFWLMMERIGSPWHWPSRKTYHAEHAYWTRLMALPATRLFILRKDGSPIGFCLACAPHPATRGLLDMHLNENRPLIEISHFGLFEEETGKGYGGYFLPRLFDALFKTHEVVYLSTRNTNHAGVVPFYERMGMEVFHTETLHSDLLAPEDPRRITANAA